MIHLVPIHASCHGGSPVDETPRWLSVNEPYFDFEGIMDRGYQASLASIAAAEVYYRIPRGGIMGVTVI
jgi:hypothetical protein